MKYNTADDRLVRVGDAFHLIQQYFRKNYVVDGEWYAGEIIRELEGLPSAEKVGKWMFSPDDAEGVCSCCNYKIYGRPYNGHYLIVPYNYCPNCGAKMEDGQ